MKEPRITSEEWLAELAALSARSDEGMTCAELCEALGLSTRTIREKLKLAHALGWVRVGKRRIATIDGKSTLAPVYQITKPKKGAK